MTDQAFTARYMPDRYVDRVQRSAVLYRLRHRCSTPKQVLACSLSLVDAWRYRLTELKRAGWRPAGDDAIHSTEGMRWTFMRNCCPSFVYCEPRMNPCHLRHFCPFCYARWVREVYLRIDAAFPNPREHNGETSIEIASHEGRMDHRIPQATTTHGGRALRGFAALQGQAPAAGSGIEFPYHLVERRFWFNLPFAPPKDAPDDVRFAEDGQLHNDYTWLKHQLGIWLGHRAKFLRNVKTEGAFSHYTVEPLPYAWQFCARQLFMVKPNFPLEKLALSANVKGKLRRFKRPSRKVIFTAVSRVCGYPKRLMTSDPDAVITLLDARRGRRLNVTTGVFRQPYTRQGEQHERADSTALI